MGLVFAVACGGNKKSNAKDDAAIPPIDAEPDAAMLPACANPVNGSNITFRKLAGTPVGGLLLATAPPNDPRLFVLEQRGAIRLYKDEVLQPDPFLDLSLDAEPTGPVVAGGEQGLLGLAFHPKYYINGTFFVFYTTKVGSDLRDVVARCQVSATNPDAADRSSCAVIRSIDDFAENHNGGMIEFGADGYLYIGTGDGGGGGDPERTAQNVDSLLGKILRIDVDTKAAGKEYGIPSTNPYAAGGGAPEVFILGLRNPWRWSFDRGTGDMWIGDVGQDQVEEMNVLKAGEQVGRNLGWSQYEAMSCYNQPCSTAGKVFPLDTHTHGTNWLSIITGQTYRGTCYPDLVGWHIYTDYSSRQLIKARLKDDGTLEKVTLPNTSPPQTASIHADARGELYLTTTQAGVYHVEAGP
jgi:glucose/arabinose dehydrogenase